MRPLPRSLLLLAYLFMGISAVMSFFIPLASFSLVGWQVYIYVWAGSLTVGGLVGAIAALLRSVGTELVAITLLLTGYTAYTALLGYRLITQPWGDGTPGTIYVLGTSLGLMFLLLRRYIELWRLIRTKDLLGGSG